MGELEAALTAARNALGAETARVKQAEVALAQAKAAAPAYPNLSGKVTELEASLAQTTAALATARNAAPAYPDLSGRVSELEAVLQTARTAAPAYPNLTGRVTELETQASASARELALARAEAKDSANQLAAANAAQAALHTRIADLQKQAAAPK